MTMPNATDQWSKTAAPRLDGAWRPDQADTETLTGNKTLVEGDNTVQRLDPGGSARNVTLPAEASCKAMWFVVVNAADAAETLTIKDDGGSTIVTADRYEVALLYCDGTSWMGWSGSATGSSPIDIDGLTALTGAIVPGTDVVLISDGGTEKKMTFQNFLNGVNDLTALAEAPATTDSVLLDDGGVAKKVTVAYLQEEVRDHLTTAQAVLMPDGAPTLEDGTAITKEDGAPTPGWAQIGSEEVVLKWATHATPGEVSYRFLVPPDCDTDSDLVLHLMGTPSSTNDSPVFTVGYTCLYPGQATNSDTEVTGESEEFTADTCIEEKTFTLANANIPGVPAQLDVHLNPKDGDLGNDSFYLYGVWVEYQRKLLTS